MKNITLSICLLALTAAAQQPQPAAAPAQPGPGQPGQMQPGRQPGPARPFQGGPGGQGMSRMPRGGEFPFAFGPGSGAMLKEAGVSDEQIKQITDAIQNSRHALIDQRAEVEKKEGDFQLLMEAPQINARDTEKALDQLLDARTKLSKTQTMMMVKMRQILTQEQWRKMSEMQRRMGPPDGQMGPGGQPGQGGRPDHRGPGGPGQRPRPDRDEDNDN